MKMLTVHEFLCFKLETGGKIVGWLNVINHIIGVLVCIAGIILFSIYKCEDLWIFLGKDKYPEIETFEDFINSCSTIQPIIFALLVFIAFFHIGLGVIAYYCIKGTNMRKHNYINPMRILLAINVVLAVLGTLSFNPIRIFVGLICIFCSGYAFVVIHSLYIVFRKEFEQGLNEETLQTNTKV